MARSDGEPRGNKARRDHVALEVLGLTHRPQQLPDTRVHLVGRVRHGQPRVAQRRMRRVARPLVALRRGVEIRPRELHGRIRPRAPRQSGGHPPADGDDVMKALVLRLVTIRGTCPAPGTAGRGRPGRELPRCRFAVRLARAGDIVRGTS